MSDDEEGDSFTQEQKIVAAVWVHEKSRNNQTWKEINQNFLARFDKKAPSRSTLFRWEKKLFETGSVDDTEKPGRPPLRLMHVPYVKASLEESPNLSLRDRAQILGLPRTTLLKILKEDLNMEFEVEEEGYLSQSSNKRHAPYNNGQWVKKNKTNEKAGTSKTN